MATALQIAAAVNEAETITGEIWETAPSAEIMLQMLWESKAFRQANQITKYEPHFHLFAAWSARRVSHLLRDERSHYAIRTAELFAAGVTTRAEMHQAHLNAEAVVIQLAETHNKSTLPTETPKSKNDADHPTGVDTRTLFGAADYMPHPQPRWLVTRSKYSAAFKPLRRAPNTPLKPSTGSCSLTAQTRS